MVVRYHCCSLATRAPCLCALTPRVVSSRAVCTDTQNELSGEALSVGSSDEMARRNSTSSSRVARTPSHVCAAAHARNFTPAPLTYDQLTQRARKTGHAPRLPSHRMPSFPRIEPFARRSCSRSRLKMGQDRALSRDPTAGPMRKKKHLTVPRMVAARRLSRWAPNRRHDAAAGSLRTRSSTKRP